MPRIKPLDQPPIVWRVMKMMDKNGNSMKFTIQEIPEDRYEDAVQYMCMYFLADEPICRCLDAKNDPLFVQDISVMWRLSLAQGISLAAFIDNPNGGKPIMVGVNILGVDVNNKKESVSRYKFKSEKCKKTLEIISNAKKNLVYERYSIDKYLYANGLSIHPDYRGYGLGKSMLKIRDFTGSLYRIPVTISMFTSIISQQIAIDAGFEEFLMINFFDLMDEEGRKYLTDVNATIKIMGKRLF